MADVTGLIRFLAQDAGRGSGTDWVALVTAAAALLTALVALAALFIEGRRNRLQLGLSNLWRLIEQWDGPEMRLRRAHLAAHLLRNPEARSNASDEAIDVLNTFELLAFLVVRSQTLRLEDAWVNFSPWAVSWWFVMRPGVDDLRQQDATIFEDFAELIERFLEYESDRRGVGREQVIPVEDDLLGFLQAEAALRGRVAGDVRRSENRLPRLWLSLRRGERG
jgi:hypothetical protein